MTAPMTVTELLKNAQQLNDNDFEHLIAELMAIRPLKSSAKPNAAEKRLLQKINAPLPAKLSERYNYLIARRDAEILTPQEYDELLRLTEEVEAFDLQRLKLMAQLADLRKITFPEVVELFKIRPVPNA